MTHELILNSVAQGLNPNDRGFCPVASDAEMSPRIMQRLLDLSDPQHFFTALAGHRSQLQTAVFSHYILPGELEHVLSRICEDGVDYRDQPNLLVHHIVLDATESTPEGPAWLSALPGFFQTRWTGPPFRFPVGRPIPALTNPESLTRRQKIARQFRWLDPAAMNLSGIADVQSDAYFAAVQNNESQITLTAPPTSPCSVWEELTGDSGWGGVLAETAFTEQPVVLVYEPGQNILPLFVESLALLPFHFAWKVTFSTCFSEMPEDISCQWKGVPAGSEAVKRLIKDWNYMVVDLTRPQGEAPAGQYVDYARNGQEFSLPVESEHHYATLALSNADTKPYVENAVSAKEKSIVPPKAVPPPIRLPKKSSGLSDFVIRRTSRLQFYCLYSIMFILLAVLLFLAIDQAGNFGILKTLRNEDPEEKLILDQPNLQDKVETEQSEEETPPEPLESEIIEKPADPMIIHTANRQTQRDPLLALWKTFIVPKFLAINYPAVKNSQIDLPPSADFPEFQPLFIFGSALDVHYVPLFALPGLNIETRFDADSLPGLVWHVEAVDTQTLETTPMFDFQLSEAGLMMIWRLEGLNNQYLYDTVLTSLGFLQLAVADSPETMREIALFLPKQVPPIKVSELAELFLSDTPEIAVEMPLNGELWPLVFAEKNPPQILRIQIRTELPDEKIQLRTITESEIQADMQTSQQAGKQTENGETVFENIAVTLTASAALEKVIWKFSDVQKPLIAEKESIQSLQSDREKRREQLKIKIMNDGLTESDQSEMETYENELKKNAARLGEIEQLLEKMPTVYKELTQNKTLYFHYSVFLESAKSKQKMLMLTTEKFNIPAENQQPKNVSK